MWLIKLFSRISVNPLLAGGFFYHNSLNQSISYSWVPGYFLLLVCFTEIPVFNANSVDPDQMPHSVASDLGPHCFVNYSFVVDDLVFYILFNMITSYQDDERRCAMKCLTVMRGIPPLVGFNPGTL